MTKIVVCVPVYDTIEPETWHDLNQAFAFASGQFCGVKTQGLAMDLLSVHGSLLDDARMAMTRSMMTIRDATHLMFIDADMTFAPDAIARLFLRDKALVGGVCFERRAPYNTTINVVDEQGKRKHLNDYPQDELIRADSTGGAFLLIKREVIEAMMATGAEDWWEGRKGVCGDELFIRRAEALGYHLWIDTAVETGHIGKQRVDAAFARKHRLTPDMVEFAYANFPGAGQPPPQKP